MHSAWKESGDKAIALAFGMKGLVPHEEIATFRNKEKYITHDEKTKL